MTALTVASVAATAGAGLAGTVLDGSLLLALPVAALAGLVSFASPCVLPLVPGYLGYVTGLTGVDLARQRRGRMLAGIGLFVLGFSVVFVAFGSLFGALGAFLTTQREVITRVLGVVVILLGVVFLGGIRPLQTVRRPGWRPAAGLVGAPLLGMVFAVGWVPCMGPTLTAVLTLSTQVGGAGRGALLAFVYCLGLGVPFVLVALGFRRGMGALAPLRRHARAVSVIGGVMLVALGVLLVTGVWTDWVGRLQGLVSGFGTAI